MWKVTVFSYAVQWSFTAQIDKENLNFIPSDFIGIQMQVKAVAIRRINCGILRLVSVVHNAILAIFDISMDFHIVVGTEPSVQFILAVGTPQDGSVKGAAVGKTIRYTADVYGTSLAEIMRRHLHFLIPLHQHFRAFQGINVLLSLTEVDGFVSILQDEMIRMLFPVVLVVVEGKAIFFLHAQHAGKLENVALIRKTYYIPRPVENNVIAYSIQILDDKNEITGNSKRILANTTHEYELKM